MDTNLTHDIDIVDEKYLQVVLDVKNALDHGNDKEAFCIAKNASAIPPEEIGNSKLGLLNIVSQEVYTDFLIYSAVNIFDENISGSRFIDLILNDGVIRSNLLERIHHNLSVNSEVDDAIVECMLDAITFRGGHVLVAHYDLLASMLTNKPKALH